ncbi:alpha/beta hydrolase family esterase [Demequina maris]|uniref:alpha/beta hydrolase family esterase n=1 Tax=Demequina maris TaxID=1638982 RepID=UPI000783813F|nr:PHB depolymerase family esterase [Demequina maris]
MGSSRVQHARARRSRPQRWWSVAAVAMLLASGCGGGDGVDEAHSPAEAGPLGDRPYEVHVPPSYDGSEAAPLLVVLHGYGMTGEELASIYDVSALADERGVLYVAPDGTVDADGERFWNATDACCNAGGIDVDDSGYLAAVIAQIESDYRVDEDRVVALGVSNGAFMAYRLACDHADTLAAIVSIAGATYLDPQDCGPSEPVSVLEVHGTADEIIAFDGGANIDAAYPSAPESVAAWAAYDGCTGALTATGERRDADSSVPGDETKASAFSGCPSGIGVELWTVEGGDHTMDFQPDVVPDLVDFLLAHPRS